ncbi:MAG TPA: hypothetical protein VKP66_02365 [Steroidobacteraceae bacterium]|nr:hypothetical protein [Steroidobacteraceae bacterium]
MSGVFGLAALMVKPAQFPSSIERVARPGTYRAVAKRLAVDG